MTLNPLFSERRVFETEERSGEGDLQVEVPLESSRCEAAALDLAELECISCGSQGGGGTGGSGSGGGGSYLNHNQNAAALTESDGDPAQPANELSQEELDSISGGSQGGGGGGSGSGGGSSYLNHNQNAARDASEADPTQPESELNPEELDSISGGSQGGGGSGSGSSGGGSSYLNHNQNAAALTESDGDPTQPANELSQEELDSISGGSQGGGGGGSSSGGGSSYLNHNQNAAIARR